MPGPGFVRKQFQVVFLISRGAQAPGFGDELHYEPDASSSRLIDSLFFVSSM